MSLSYYELRCEECGEETPHPVDEYLAEDMIDLHPHDDVEREEIPAEEVTV